MDSSDQLNARGGDHPVLRWTWCVLLAVFCISALAGWIQVKRSRAVYAPSAVTQADWYSVEPVEFQAGKPGARHPDFVRMIGHQSGTNSMPALQVKLPYRPLGYVLHVGIHRTDRHPANLEIAVNGEVLGTHLANYHRRADIFEVTVPSELLEREGDNALTVGNVGVGAWFGRMLIIPYGCLRTPLQVVLPISGFLLLLLGAVKQHMRGRSVRAIVPGLVVFFIYCHALFASKIVPMAGIAFSDCDELVQPFLTNVMEYDLTKHMLCLPVIHLLWRVFSVIGWAEMVALAGAFALVAAANVAVAHLVFTRLVRHGLGAMLLTLCYAGSFSIWLYSSIFETFILSSLLANLFLLVWLASRGTPSLGRACINAVMVVLCGLAHPPLLVFLGAVIHEWLRMWRKRDLAMTLAGVVLLVLVTCGGFLGGRFVMRRAYIAGSDELATGSVAEEYADAGKMVELYASTDNMTWDNVGNIVMNQCVYAVAGREPTFDWSGGWSSGRAYLGRPTGWLVVVGIALLWGLAGRGIVLRRRKLLETGALVALVVLPTMLFYLWFNPGEMLLYAPPMMTIMLGWLAWAGRPGAERLFDGALAVLTGTAISINTVAIMSFL